MGKRYKAKVREQLLEQVLISGERISVVARRLGVKESSAYFWVKRARQVKAPEFARLLPAAPPAGAALALEVGGAVVRVEQGFDAALLREVVLALAGQAS